LPPTLLDQLVYLSLLMGKLDLAIDHEGLPMALYLPLSQVLIRLDKLQYHRLDQQDIRMLPLLMDLLHRLVKQLEFGMLRALLLVLLLVVLLLRVL